MSGQLLGGDGSRTYETLLAPLRRAAPIRYPHRVIQRYERDTTLGLRWGLELLAVVNAFAFCGGGTGGRRGGSRHYLGSREAGGLE